jgi:hypothetical protein
MKKKKEITVDPEIGEAISQSYTHLAKRVAELEMVLKELLRDDNEFELLQQHFNTQLTRLNKLYAERDEHMQHMLSQQEKMIKSLGRRIEKLEASQD